MKKLHGVLGIAGILGVALLTSGFWLHRAQPGASPSSNSPQPVVVAPNPDRVETVTVEEKQTFSVLMETAGVPGSVANAIYAAALPVYDLASVRVGKSFTLISAPGASVGDIKELVYPASTEQELHVRRTADGWVAALEKIDYEVRVKTVRGTVTSSLYAAGLAAGIDERAVIGLANVFEWTIDFAQDVRVGDTFSFVYEERYRNGQYVMPGNIFAAEYVNDGVKHRAYQFTNAKGEEGYYDEKGESLKKMFLKAPLAFKYMSSGFTTGMRYVSAFSTSTKHRAIDYAAAKGTPIRATAAGTVVSAGWNGPYGNFVSIRHNGTYTTNYAHQSKLAVKRGQKVVQGQVIGYVGSTGFSTGPHLHYEMVKNGVKINPLKETFPSSDPIAADELAAFTATVPTWDTQL